MSRALPVALVLAFGCTTDAGKDVADATKRAKQSIDDATKTTVKVADDATKAIDDAAKASTKAADDATKAIDDATKTATTFADTTKAAFDSTATTTKRAWAGLTSDGELSAAALAWISSQTEEGSDMRGLLAKGIQVAPVALELGRVLNGAVDSETAIEPIYQSLEGRDPAEVDKAIAAMPRVEVIDGVKIGFSSLDRLDAGAQVTERAYLLTWRRDDALIGMVYRSKREIDIDKLVREAPRLLGLTRDALAKDGAPGPN